MATPQNCVNVTVALPVEQARTLDHVIAHLQREEGPARRISRSDVVRRALDAFCACIPEPAATPEVRVRRRPYSTVRADQPEPTA